MKPEDILDGLGQVSDRMVLDAQSLKKTPRRSLKWGSLAACILCGVVLLGVCAAKLWNRDDQQSLKPPETTIPTVVSEPPQNSAEESVTEPAETREPRAAEPGQVIVNGYQMVVRDDAIYFVDPYVGLMAMDPETKTTKTILGNGTCSLVESEGSLYCLDRATRQVDLVENGDVTTLVTLENVGPGYPILLGVSDGYVCWQQDWTIYEASIEDGAARKILPKDGEESGYFSCGVYQGMLYTVNELEEQLYCTALDTGETTAVELTNEDGVTVKWTAYTTGQMGRIVDGQIYSMGYLENDESETPIGICYDLSDGSLTEVPLSTEVAENADIDVWDGTLYLLHVTYYDSGEYSDSLISYNPETGEETAILDENQTADMGGIINWQMTSGGIYYTKSVESGLYYYDLSTGTSTQVYRSDGIYGSLVMEPDFYWQSGNVYDVGAWYEHFNEKKDYYDLTATENGVYYVNPGEGVYRYIPEEEQIEQLISGKACRILNCDEGLYATCSDSGEVYEIKDGAAELLVTLEKETQIAIKPIAVTNGKLYWNYFVTDLSTGETQIDPIFRLKKSQPQIMHQGKIYCLGGNGEIGYVDPNGGTESYVPLTQALGTREDDWAVRFFDDSAIALQKTENGTGFDVYQISYEDGNIKWLGTVEGETVSILNLEGDILYLEPMQEVLPTGIVALNITTGESQTIMEENPVLTGTEIQVWNGVCYSACRELGVMEFGTYDLETGVETTYPADDSMVSE